jgi:gliding motility-associated protein GldC
MIAARTRYLQLSVQTAIIMKESTIKIDVALDEQKVPQQILWSATDSTAEHRQQANAMMVSFWDPSDKAALRIDLWTKDMMVDEMVDFYYQSLMGMADTLQRSTGQAELVHDLQHFAQDFFKKFQESQRKA